MGHQVALTICAEIKGGHGEALAQLLTAMSDDSAHNRVIPFGDLPAIHFARLLVVDAGEESPILLLMLDGDAPQRRRLQELVKIAGTGLDEVFRHCEGYPADGELTPRKRVAYLRSRMTSVEVFYVHAVGRVLEQIRQEEHLREAIQAFLDRLPQSAEIQSASQICRTIRAFVDGEPALAWAKRPAPPLELSFRVGEALHKYGVLVLLLVLLPALIPAALAWLIVLRIHELRDPPPAIKLDPARLRALGEREDFGVQNAISTLAEIKPGGFWKLTATIFLGVANYSSRHIFTNGSLSGLTTVHFARLMKLDKGRKVLFTSYYDGSLESYMNDFVDQVAWVLNSVFGNQNGYPRTRWLVLGGARDEQGFKAFLRGHQIPTQVWYSAYGDLAAVNADNNARIRAGLYGDMSETEAAEWLQRF